MMFVKEICVNVMLGNFYILHCFFITLKFLKPLKKYCSIKNLIFSNLEMAKLQELRKQSKKIIMETSVLQQVEVSQPTSISLDIFAQTNKEVT